MARYYVDGDGNYLGGFEGDGADPPEGAIEVDAPPGHARQKWDGAAWLAYTPPPAPPEPRAWLERLTDAKQHAIMTAALGNAAILLWVMKASGSRDIDVTSAETIAGVGALVSAGVLDDADRTLLLTP